MKTNDILLATGLSKTKETSSHASSIANIYKLLAEIKKDIVSIETEKVILFFGKKTEKYYSRSARCYQYIETSKGYEIEAVKFTIKTNIGKYTTTIPSIMPILSNFNSLLGINTTEQNKSKSDTLKSVCKIDAVVMKKASEFTDKTKDYYRENLKHICLSLSNNKLDIVSTDAHALYKKEMFVDTDITEQILVSLDEYKKALFNDKKVFHLEYDTETKKYFLNGVEINDKGISMQT